MSTENETGVEAARLPIFTNQSRCARCSAGYGIWVMFCRACPEVPDAGDHYHLERNRQKQTQCPIRIARTAPSRGRSRGARSPRSIRVAAMGAVRYRLRMSDLDLDSLDAKLKAEHRILKSRNYFTRTSDAGTLPTLTYV